MTSSGVYAVTSSGLYAAYVFYNHAEVVAVRCALPFVSERAAAHMGCANLWLREESTIMLQTTMAWVATIAGLLIPLANRSVGAGFTFLAAFWMYSHLSFATSAPHQPFVVLSFIYVAWRGTGDNQLSQVVLRAALATSYAWSGLAKLSTDEWQRGLVFEILSFRGCLRPWVSWHPVIPALVSSASTPMCIAALAVECGLPMVELWALCTRNRCDLCLCRGAVVLAWVASAGMHVGILLLMPLTEVSLGMLLFHAMALDAAITAIAATETGGGNAAGGTEGRSLASPLVVSSSANPERLGSTLCTPCNATRLCVLCLTVLGFSIRPLDCFVPRAFHKWARVELVRPEGSAASLQKGVQLLFPLPASGFEKWPCMSSTFPRADKRHVRSNGWLITVFEPATSASAMSASAPPPSGRTSARSIRWRSGSSCSSALYPYLSGGHTWHHNVARCLRGGTTHSGCRQMIALLLCACSPLHGTHLATQIRAELLHIPSNFTVSAVRFRWADGHEVRRWRCCAGGELSVASRVSAGNRSRVTVQHRRGQSEASDMTRGEPRR